MTDSQKTDEFLAHFGVMGMHWGQRKQQPMDQSRVDMSRSQKTRNQQVSSIKRGRTKLDFVNGNANASRSIQSGKFMATWILSHIGASKIAMLSGNPKVKFGAHVAANLLTVGVLIKQLQNIDDINNAVDAKKKKH